MERIRKAEKRENVLILLASMILSIIGIGLVYAFFDKNTILMLVGGTITILGMFYVFQKIILLNRGDLPLISILLKEPQKVVWVYSMVTQRMPFGFQINQTGTMYFKLMDGNEKTLSLPASELKNISEMLNYHLPHATFGYTEERAQWFRAHPAMLLKDERNEKPE